MTKIPNTASRRTTTTAKWLAVFFLVSACSDDPSAEQKNWGGMDGEYTGPIQEACAELTVQACCAYDPEALDPDGNDSAYLRCTRTVYNSACRSVRVDCANGDRCIRSSVDFAACETAVGQCPAIGTPAPAVCISKACATAAEGCAEDPGVDD